MKQKLKYLFPLLAIFVLLWGLLTLAEKLALLISITILTGYIIYQLRLDRNRPARNPLNPLNGLKQVEGGQSRQVDRVEKARDALTQLLRQSLQIPAGRFRQEVDALCLSADRLVAGLEANPDRQKQLKSLPDLLFQAKNHLRDYAHLDTDPASQARKHELQRELQVVHESLKDLDG